MVLGANGAGKSTWVRSHRKDLPQPFYDADALAQLLGDYNDRTCQITARAMIDAAVAHNIQRGVSFGIETTFAGNSRPNMVRAAHAAGYVCTAVFIGTADPYTNLDRVVGRVTSDTGHEVPPDEVIRRWTAVRGNLVATSNCFERIVLLDGDRGEPDQPLAVISAEGTSVADGAALPQWAQTLVRAIQEARSAPAPQAPAGGHTLR